MNKPLILFRPKLPKLSKNESKVLELLVGAGKLIVPIYQEQEKQIRQDDNFYPKGVSKEEIERIAEKNPDIFSSFTVVEEVNGRLAAIPYHVKYAKLLKPIADKLNEASRISENKTFARFLKIQAQALLDGSYEKAMAAYLKMTYILDISIGPIEHFDNQLFFRKAPYQAWVGVVDAEGTKKLNYYRSIALSAKRKALIPEERIENFEKVKVKVDDLVLLSGLMAETPFVGINLPMNLKLVEKYGSKVTIFNQVNDLRMNEQIIPTFNKIFSIGFRQGFSSEDLRRGSLRYVALHELAHNYLYYKKAPDLNELLPPIYELAATILGFRMGGSLLLKDIITNKQLESMIIAFMCRSYYLIEKNKNNKTLRNYALGGTVFINFMLISGALKQHQGLTVTNYMKIFVSLQELFEILEVLLLRGKRKDAEVFFKKYGKLRNFS